MLAHHLPKRARSLLRSAPWTVPARLPNRAADRHSSLFCGSGTFTVADGMRIEIGGNPLTKGQRETSDPCICLASMFETVYRALADDRIVRAGITCEALADEFCQLALGSPGVGSSRDPAFLFPP